MHQGAAAAVAPQEVTGLSATLAALPTGAYHVCVEAFDAAGNGRVADDPPADANAAGAHLRPQTTPRGIGVLALDHGANWWGRLLAEPRLKVFAALEIGTASFALISLPLFERAHWQVRWG